MRIRPNEKDYENQVAPCLECNEHVVLLDAGMECDFVECKKCGCKDVVLKDKFMVACDIFSKD